MEDRNEFERFAALQPRRVSGPKTVTKEWRKILQMVNTVTKYRGQGGLYFQNIIGFQGTSVNKVLLKHMRKVQPSVSRFKEN